MSVLAGAAAQITTLLEQITNTLVAYNLALDTYNSLNSGESLDGHNIAMFVQINGVQVRLPVPFNSQEVADRIASGCNLLSTDLAEKWQLLKQIADDANTYIADAREKQQAQLQAEMPQVSDVVPTPTDPVTGQPIPPPLAGLVPVADGSTVPPVARSAGPVRRMSVPGQ